MELEDACCRKQGEERSLNIDLRVPGSTRSRSQVMYISIEITVNSPGIYISVDLHVDSSCPRLAGPRAFT